LVPTHSTRIAALEAAAAVQFFDARPSSGHARNPWALANHLLGKS